MNKEELEKCKETALIKGLRATANELIDKTTAMVEKLKDNMVYGDIFKSNIETIHEQLAELGIIREEWRRLIKVKDDETHLRQIQYYREREEKLLKEKENEKS